MSESDEQKAPELPTLTEGMRLADLGRAHAAPEAAVRGGEGLPGDRDLLLLIFKQVEHLPELIHELHELQGLRAELVGIRSELVTHTGSNADTFGDHAKRLEDLERSHRSLLERFEKLERDTNAVRTSEPKP